MGLSDIEDGLQLHMDDQPYSCLCSECDEELDIERCVVDSGMDLRLTIWPCKCTAKKEDESE